MNELKKLCGELADINSTLALLEWDQQLFMPRYGENGRASQIAYFSRKAHDLISSNRFGELINEQKSKLQSMEFGSDDYSLIRLLLRDYEKACRIPSDYVEKFSELTSKAFGSWSRAKEASDFSLFRDDLNNIFAMRREYCSFFEKSENLYDILLDDFEPSMKTKDVLEIFAPLRVEQLELIRRISEKPQVDDSFLKGSFAEKSQWKLGKIAATKVGFNWDKGRLDSSEHPFTTTFNLSDVRITTHIYENNLLSSLYSIIHESGHAIYEQSVANHLDRTPLGTGASLAIHESQSRLWENMVGRSRGFLDNLYPEIKREFSQFSNVSSEDFYRAVNKVSAGAIRTESDEATYNLHIMLRLELEIAMINQTICVDDLPQIWREKMQEYLGVKIDNDKIGVLQDVHWATGGIGYFPTYALGNIFAAQLWEQMEIDLGSLDQLLLDDNLEPIKDYLTKNIYCHGAKFTPAELIEKSTGKKLQSNSYLKYLNKKFSDIYKL